MIVTCFDKRKLQEAHDSLDNANVILIQAFKFEFNKMVNEECVELIEHIVNPGDKKLGSLNTNLQHLANILSKSITLQTEITDLLNENK